MKHWTIVLLVVLLTFSLFAIPAFAHDGTEVVTDEHGHDASVHAAESTGLTTGEMIGLIISGVVLLVLVVLGIKFREKVAKFFRVYKSESKKIVWLPWNQTLKSTYVVLVVMVICAVVICALDIGLNTGFRAFIDLFGAAA